MKEALAALWGALTAYPQSLDDYVGVGRWLIYKKLLIILAILLALAAILLPLWWLWPKEEERLPEFYHYEEALEGFSGRAIILDDNGCPIYRGQIAAGLRSGVGRELSGEDGAVLYQGEFDSDRYGGQGRLYREGALRYEGGFANGLYSGDGTLYDAGGARLYQGQFARGLYNGRGSLFGKGEELVYEGEFLDGLYSGQGSLYGPGGTALYVGSFARGRYEGAGLLNTPQGTILYEGEFRDGLYHGQGSLYAEDGSRLRFEGMFTRGQPGREGRLYNSRGALLYDGPVREGRVDFPALLGLPLKELEGLVAELPVVYYAGGGVGYLYRELSFAVLTRYDYTAQQPDGEQDGPVELFAGPADNLVADLLLVGGEGAAGLLPGAGVELEYEELDAMEVFMESRLAGVRDPGARLDVEARVIARGDHLYQVDGLPETLPFDGEGRYKDEVYYYHRSQDSSKGGEPWVVFIKKAKLGG